MAKQFIYCVILFTSAATFSLIAVAKCNTLSGDWQGAYKINPHYFGFSVGYCNYSSSISISPSRNQRYDATITNTLVKSDGRAGKSCQQAFIVKAKMVCDASGVILTTEQGKALPSIDMRSKWQANGGLVSKGDFEHQYGERSLDIDYSFRMSKE